MVILLACFNCVLLENSFHCAHKLLYKLYSGSHILSPLCENILSPSLLTPEFEHSVEKIQKCVAFKKSPLGLKKRNTQRTSFPDLGLDSVDFANGAKQKSEIAYLRKFHTVY